MVTAQHSAGAPAQCRMRVMKCSSSTYTWLHWRQQQAAGANKDRTTDQVVSEPALILN